MTQSPTDPSSDGTSERGRSWLALMVLLAICFVVAGLGGFATASSVETWYPTLNKPFFNPPAWVFGPVWTLLYAMMAVAAWRIWRQPPSGLRTAALMLFGVQLTLNLMWSLVFFGLRMPGAAAVEIAVLWFAIAATLWQFMRLKKLAGWLLTPYLAWVSFAAVLNVSIWWLN